MPSKYYLGIDQGTTGTASLLLDCNWNVCGKGYMEIAQIYPKPGWVEHDAIELYHSVIGTAEQAIMQASVHPNNIASIGIDNQGETVVAWNSQTGLPLYNAIVWQDKRTSAMAEELKKNYGDLIQGKTGLQVDSYFSATKIHWLLKNVPEVQAALKNGTLMIGTTDTWFIWNLCGRYVTDVSTASRTMLMNLHSGTWDEDILQMLDIPLNILPEICDSDCLNCSTTKEAFFGASIPIGGSMVDQQAALLGQGCVEAGDVKTTYGTGCFMLMNTGGTPVNSQNGLLTTVAWQIGQQRKYALDAGIYVAGSAIQWLKNGLKLIDNVNEVSALAESISDNGGVYFVPAFSGLAAPYWDEYARGTIVGLTAAATTAHLTRAVQESIAYQVYDNVQVMQADAQSCIQAMRVDGGMVKSNFLMQFQADILGIPIELPKISECTALGAAYVGALGVGLLENLEACKKQWKRKQRFEPHMSEDQRGQLLYQWHRGVDRAKGWLENE